MTANATEVNALLARATFISSLRDTANKAAEAHHVVMFTDGAAASRLWATSQELFALASDEESACHTVARAMQPEGHALSEINRMLPQATGTHRDLLLAMRDGQPAPEVAEDDEGDRL